MTSPSSAAERWVARNRGRLAVIACGLLGSMLGIWTLARRGPLPGEERLTVELQRGGAGETLKQVADFVEMLPKAPVAFLTVTVAVAIVLRRMGRRAALLVATASLVVAFNALLKAMLGSTDAYVEIRAQVTDNFPSGGVAYATAVFGAFAWLGWIGRQREVSVVAVGLLIATGLSRVARGAHVPSDVLGGYAVGAAWLILTLIVFAPEASRTTGAHGCDPAHPVSSP